MHPYRVLAVIGILVLAGISLPYFLAGAPMDAKVSYEVELLVEEEGTYGATGQYHYYSVALGEVSASAELVGGSALDRWLRAFYFIDEEGLSGDEAKQPLYRLQVSLRENFNGNWVVVGEIAYDYLDNEVRAAGYADCTVSNSFYLPGVDEGDYQIQVGLWVRDPDSDWRSLGGETVTVHL